MAKTKKVLTKGVKEKINELLILLKDVPEAQKMRGLASAYGEKQEEKYKLLGFLDNEGGWNQEAIDLSLLKFHLKAALGEESSLEFLEGSYFISDEDAAATDINGNDIGWE